MTLHPVVALLALALSPPGRAAQGRDPRFATADSALATCAARAAKDDKRGAADAARIAAALYVALGESRPTDPDPLVGRARVISQCELPLAGFLRKPGLSNRAEELLHRALALDSSHWGARYSLALNYYHAPEFVGKTSAGIVEFERLIRQQSNATAFPEMARPYAYLGDLYSREGRAADAERTWRQGAGLFPADSLLRRRLDRLSPKP